MISLPSSFRRPHLPLPPSHPLTLPLRPSAHRHHPLTPPPQAAVAHHAQGHTGAPHSLFRRLSRDGLLLHLDDLRAVDGASRDSRAIAAELAAMHQADAVSLPQFAAFFEEDPAAARFPWLMRAALLVGEGVGVEDGTASGA